VLPSRWLLPLPLILAPLACSGSTMSTGGGSTVTKAAIGTGLALAAAGINRAVTHECWAACRPGLVCDHASGLCVEEGTAQSPTTRRHPLEPVNANPPGHEYEIPALGACGGDAGDCADAGSADAVGDAGAR
jgi:hypothetical protein